MPSPHTERQAQSAQATAANRATGTAKARKETRQAVPEGVPLLTRPTVQTEQPSRPGGIEQPHRRCEASHAVLRPIRRHAHWASLGQHTHGRISLRQAVPLDGITSGQASQFFPGTDFNTTHTFTDETSISKALHYWNFTARKTFLHRAPDRTTAGPPQRKLIWNPTAAPTTQTVVLALAGVFSWTVQVLASNGRPPTGTLNFQYSAFSDSHTLVTGDAGLHTFTNPGTTNAGFPTVVNANFVGSGGFANSTWTPTQVTTISMPVETPTVIHISLGGPRAVDFPTDAVWYTRDGSLSVVVTGVSPNWIVTATSGSFIPGVPAKAWGFFSQYYGLGPSWL